MTPEQAQELLDIANRSETDGQRPVTVAASHAPLAEAAYALAQTVANLHYEYAVATGPEHSPVYAAMNSQGRFIGTTLALADWWQTKGEAQDLVDELRGENEHSTARIVRRLVGEPEVVE